MAEKETPLFIRVNRAIRAVLLDRRVMPVIMGFYIWFALISVDRDGSIIRNIFSTFGVPSDAIEIDPFNRVIITALIAAFVAFFFRVGVDVIRSGLPELSAERSQYEQETFVSQDTARIEAMVKKLLESKEGQIGNVTLSKTERDKLIEKIASNSVINDEFVKNLSEKTASDNFERYQKAALARLSGQIEHLGRRANFSLLWGLAFAAGGLFALYFSFFSNPPQAYADLYQTTLLYLPRLTMVLIIEVVAFFFLKLYARTLSELRYAQNEITNVELKLISVHASVRYNLKNTLNQAVKILSNTERNFVLTKGQTTVEIERERSDVEGMSATIAAASELIHGAKARKTSLRKKGS